jgi:hypothetical protein
MVEKILFDASQQEALRKYPVDPQSKNTVPGI